MRSRSPYGAFATGLLAPFCIVQGASLADVVKVGVYLADGSEFAPMNEVYAEFFGESKRARSSA